jgi:hypothetical protein
MPFYILRGKRVVIEPSYLAWAIWFHHTDRSVAKTPIGKHAEVSTVFMGEGLIRSTQPTEGPPMVFETLVRGGKHDGLKRLSSSWRMAERVHAEVVAEVTKRRSSGRR